MTAHPANLRTAAVLHVGNALDAKPATVVHSVDCNVDPGVEGSGLMNTVQRIIVGIPSVGAGNPVLSFSVELARRLDAELALVHAYHAGASIAHTYDMLGYSGDDAEHHYTAFLTAKLQAMVAGVPAPRRIVSHAAAGAPEQVLSTHASVIGADLIVIGPSRRGTVWRRLVGGCSDRTIRMSPCPVLVSRAPLSLAGTRVLFATDLSDYSIGIHEQAMKIVAPLLARDGKARSVLVLAGVPLVATSEERTLLEDLARHELDHFLTERSSSPFSVESCVRFGDPARQILNEAESWDADLLVIGSRSRSGLERLLVGSVSSEVIDRSGINVLIVPPRVAEAAAPVVAAEPRLLAAGPSAQPLFLAPGEPMKLSDGGLLSE
jgi:nucleotide-binding universal stress UspA family protein